MGHHLQGNGTVVRHDGTASAGAAGDRRACRQAQQSTQTLRTRIRRRPEHLAPRAFFGVLFVQATAPQDTGREPGDARTRLRPSHARTDVIDRARNMPAVAAGTTRDAQPRHPSRTGAVRLPGARPRPVHHPLIRYNRPDSRGGTEPTGAFSCSTASSITRAHTRQSCLDPHPRPPARPRPTCSTASTTDSSKLWPHRTARCSSSPGPVLGRRGSSVRASRIWYATAASTPARSPP